MTVNYQSRRDRLITALQQEFPKPIMKRFFEQFAIELYGSIFRAILEMSKESLFTSKLYLQSKIKYFILKDILGWDEKKIDKWIYRRTGTKS